MFAFNRGEVSKAALARVDNEKLRLASECQVNWLPAVVGDMMLRPGLRMINEVFDDAAGVMVPFVFSKFDTAIIELTPNIMRVEIAGQLVTRNAVTTVVSDPTFDGGGSWTTANTTAGATVAIGSGEAVLTAVPVGSLAQIQQVLAIPSADVGEEHGLRIVVTNGPVTLRGGSSAGLSDIIAQTAIDTGTHSLAFTPTTSSVTLQIESADAWQKILSQVSIEAAGIMTLPTPWGSTEVAPGITVLDTVRTDESLDVVYVAAYGLQQHQIERRGVAPGAMGWSVVLYRSQAGPFSTENITDITLASSAETGNANITASRNFFQPGHVGALIQMFTPSQFNEASLAANNAFSEPVEVTGVGNDRNYTWSFEGNWSGELNFQRSYDSATSGFVVVLGALSTTATSGNFQSLTGGTSGTATGQPDLDNVIAWERIGFQSGEYGGGVASVSSSFNGGGIFGMARILEVLSPTEVSVEIIEPFSSTQATSLWNISDWSTLNGWPTSLVFFEGRLFWAGTDNLWGSEPDDFTGFATQDNEGNDLGDADAIIETFGSGPADSVNWLLALTRLMAGRDMSVESIRASSFDEVLTASDISTKACSTQGAARLKPVKIDKEGLYVSGGGRCFSLRYDPDQMDYSQHDLTRLNTDIFIPGFVDSAVSRQPDTFWWLPRGDGQCASLLYDTEDDVVGWWRMQTLGVIENVCVLPAPSGTEDEVFFTVRRVINGVTRRFREQLAPRANCIGGQINQLLDSHFVYQGVAVTTVQVSWLPLTLVGVWADGAFLGTTTSDGSGNVAMPDGNAHENIVVGLLGGVYTANAAEPSFTPVASVAVPASYNGFPAEVFADNRRIGPLVVANGAITLPEGRTAQVITACVGFVAPFMSAKLAYAAVGGTAISQRKKVDHLGLLLLDTAPAGLQIGQRMDLLDPMPAIEQDAVVPAGTVYDVYDDDMMPVPGQWDTDARLCLLAQAPQPARVAGLVIGMTTNG
jgi:hypothetical protein